MNRKSSIVFEYHNKIKISYLLHNDRTKPTNNSIFSTKDNYTNLSSKTSIKNFYNVLGSRIVKYEKKTKRKIQKKTIKHISSIINLNEKHTKKDLEKVVKYLEEKLDTKVIMYSIHKDEGYIDNQGKKHINYHGHIEMVGLDSNGFSIRRKIDRKFLINLQSDIAKILNMERGTSRKITKRKRLNTYEYKEHIKRQEEELKLLNDRINQLEQQNKTLEEEKQTLIDINTKLKENENKLTIQVKQYNKFLKDFRNVIKNLNKQLELYTKEDYKKISELQTIIKYNKNYKEILKLEEIKEYTNNINNLIRYFENKLKNNKHKQQLRKNINEIYESNFEM